MAIRKRLGDMLTDLNYISNIELQNALATQKSTGKKLGEIFIESGVITEEDLLSVLETQLEIPRINLEVTKVDKKAVTAIPESLARKYVVLPIGFEENELVVVVNDPLNILATEDVAISSGYNVKIVLDKRERIKNAIARYYSENYMATRMDDFDAPVEKEKSQEDELREEEIKNAPAVKLLNTILESSVRNKGSDIHIEPFETKFIVRYRVDGSLYSLFESPKERLSAIVTRIKLMGNMNIAEKRIPQDGRITTMIDGDEVDVRVSILPTVHGEKVVMRILDKKVFNIDKKDLGLIGEDLRKTSKIISEPYGIVLVTGPTGSGKSTTLYSLLKDLNNIHENIVTVEDPVEYTVDGINQVSVNTKAGLTFASGLKAILRQDPDTIMIGEIRDTETAQIAIRAAITGHLVLSTIHTNDAPSSVVRLKDMGIAPYLVSTSLAGIVAQRLMRKVCIHCARPYKASDYEKEMLGISLDRNIQLYEKVGCDACRTSGYSGRVAIYEIMEINKEIRNLIAKDSDVEDIKNAALRNGMKTLSKSAMEVVLKGYSTIEELLRITLLDN